MEDKKTVEYWLERKELAQNRIQELLLGATSGVKSSKSGDDELVEHNLKDQMDSLYRYISYCDDMIEELKNQSDKIGILYIERDQIYGI